MFLLGPFGFSFPLALVALAGLPALWWLLRVTPPPPRVVAFPAIRLLRDLAGPEETPRSHTFMDLAVAPVAGGAADPRLRGAGMETGGSVQRIRASCHRGG